MVEQLVPMLVIYKGAMAGGRWPVSKESLTIGRSKECDIVIPERQISRYHARVECDEAGYIVRDLGSKNGTVVNGEVLSEQPYQLRDGDEILLANVVYIGFIAGEATLPLEDIIYAPGELLVDEATKSVRLGRCELDPPLSPAQFSLLSLLITAEGSVVSREDVIDAIWPDAEGGVTDQAVDALVYRLRERLVELNSDHNYITTVRGHGFRFA